jgi:DNA processing protein
VLNTHTARLCLLGFNHVRGIGAVRLQHLLQTFGDAETAWKAPAAALRQSGLSEKLVQNLVETRANLDLAMVWERLDEQGIQVITWEDEDYPRRLREISQPPPVLYVRGNVLSDDDFSVAIVGTRRVTSYGRRAAEDIAAALAQQHITVVSGLARGVDSIAHQAALDGGGRTLAVLGCGIDRIYPPEHLRLAEEICNHGALLSDYPPGTEPDAANFPPRNRIISGLALAVVVVEAGITSGALITAKFAADQGRDVFAVPGSIYSPSSRGTNSLIRDGVSPVTEPRDILDGLGLEKVEDYRSARSSLPENASEMKLLSLLDNEPTHMDEIQAQSGLPIDEVSATLALMELKGMVQQVGGMNYVIRESG